MEGMVPYTQAAVERAMKVPLLLTKNFALAYTNLFPLIDRAGCLGSRFEVLFHERQAMGDEPTEYIRVEQDDDSDDRAESYGVPGDEAEDDAFVADLLGGGGGDGDGLGVDHFSHHASGTVGGAHEDGVDAELLRSNSLQAAEESVGGGVTAGERHSQPAQEGAEEWI